MEAFLYWWWQLFRVINIFLLATLLYRFVWVCMCVCVVCVWGVCVCVCVCVCACACVCVCVCVCVMCSRIEFVADFVK